MAVRIRLTRMGRKKRPFYRVVVADSRSPRDGRYIECVGTYNPIPATPEVNLDEERINYWLDQGAQPSDTVKSLFKHDGMIFRRYLKTKGYDDTRIEEEMKKWEVLQLEKKRRSEAAAAEKAPEVKTSEDAPKEEPVEEKAPEAKEADAKEEAEVKEEAPAVEEAPAEEAPSEDDKAEA